MYLRPKNAHKNSFVFPDCVFRTFSGYACAVLMFNVYMCRKKMAGLLESDVEKAHKAIAYLSSISVAASTTPTSSTNVGNLSSSETGKKSTPVMEAADKALDALRRMRAGMTADRRVEKRKIEVSMLFNKKPKVEKKRVVWRHKFVCLAHRDLASYPALEKILTVLHQDGCSNCVGLVMFTCTYHDYTLIQDSWTCPLHFLVKYRAKFPVHFPSVVR